MSLRTSGEPYLRRTIGRGDIWVNEYVIRYDGKPSHVVGIMEFAGSKVIRETVYVTDAWDPPAWRAQWVEPMDTDPSPPEPRE